MKNIFTLLFALIFMLSASIAISAQQKNLVGNIKNTSIADGCGCYFKKAGRLIFFDGFEKVAWMNIDGRDVKLKLIKETNSKGKIKVGSRTVSRYETEGITVDVVQVATKVPLREGEEVTDFTVTITVQKDTRKQIVKAVGGCGC